ncbi:hypothetical protein ACFROD_06615 [Streptomyces mirabilis]|uniref:hypothetical protein n=1 Tax=Streptomyces mirabilis TaxID=68239 RepID=UPI00368ADFB2
MASAWEAAPAPGLRGRDRVQRPAAQLLVEVEPVTEQCGGLGALSLVRGEGVVLDLVLLGVRGPVRGVGVAPLAADDHVVDVFAVGMVGFGAASAGIGLAPDIGGSETAHAGRSSCPRSTGPR